MLGRTYWRYQHRVLQPYIPLLSIFLHGNDFQDKSRVHIETYEVLGEEFASGFLCSTSVLEPLFTG